MRPNLISNVLKSNLLVALVASDLAGSTVFGSGGFATTGPAEEVATYQIFRKISDGQRFVEARCIGIPGTAKSGVAMALFSVEGDTTGLNFSRELEFAEGSSVTVIASTSPANYRTHIVLIRPGQRAEFAGSETVYAKLESGSDWLQCWLNSSRRLWSQELGQATPQGAE